MQQQNLVMQSTRRTINIILTFNGTNIFIKNSAEVGGAIDAFDNAEFTFNGTNIFINNSVHYGGGAICTAYNAVFTESILPHAGNK